MHLNQKKCDNYKYYYHVGISLMEKIPKRCAAHRIRLIWHRALETAGAATAVEAMEEQGTAGQEKAADSALADL